VNGGGQYLSAAAAGTLAAAGFAWRWLREVGRPRVILTGPDRS